MVEQVVDICDFDDSTGTHDSDPAAHIPYYSQVMRNQQVGQVKLKFQVL